MQSLSEDLQSKEQSIKELLAKSIPTNAVPPAESSDLVSAESTLNKLLWEIQHAAEDTGERYDRPPGLLLLSRPSHAYPRLLPCRPRCSPPQAPKRTCCASATAGRRRTGRRARDPLAGCPAGGRAGRKWFDGGALMTWA